MKGGDLLPLADRQGHVVVGVGPPVGRHEFVPRRGPHGGNHPRVLHPGRHDLFIDHPRAGLVHASAGLIPLGPPLPCHERRADEECEKGPANEANDGH